MTTETHKPLRVFCSYAREDEEHLNVLRAWLSGLKRQGLIEWWHDREIVPGWEWEEAIDKRLRTADIILLLVTSDFLGSDYVYEKEIRAAIERYEQHEARVIAIIVRPALWQDTPLKKFQLLPKDAQPITTWDNRDEAWLDVARGIEKAVQEFLVERRERERVAKEQYRKVVGEAWADNRVSDAEAERLGALASELGLETDTAADIEHAVMDETIEAILERQKWEDRERRLEGLYDRARQLHRDREWQAVVDVFTQIQSEDLAYPDPEKLLASAREALTFKDVVSAAQKPPAQERLRAISDPVTLEGHTRAVVSVAFSPDGQLLASSSRDKAVGIWRVENGELLRRLEGHEKPVNAVGFSPNGQLLASGSGSERWGRGDDTARLWSVESGELLRTLKGHTHSVESVAFSPDGQLLASSSRDKTVRLWSIESGELSRTLEGHADGVFTVAISPDGQLLASGSNDSTARLWSVESGELLRTLVLRLSAVFSVAFSPDGQLLASGSNDRRVNLWSIT